MCETCKASFLVPASVLSGAPRKVRCGRCGHVWFAGKTPSSCVAVSLPQKAQAGTAAPSHVSPIGLSVPLARNEEPERNETFDENTPFRSSWKLFVLWGTGIALGIVTLSLGLGLAFQRPIVHAWPEIRPLYKTFGLIGTVQDNMLILREIRSVRRYQDGAMRLIVTGQILNQAEQPAVLPPLDAQAIGPSGDIIQTWRIEPVQATLPPKGALDFSSVVLCPDESVTEVNLRFAGAPAHDE